MLSQSRTRNIIYIHVNLNKFKYMYLYNNVQRGNAKQDVEFSSFRSPLWRLFQPLPAGGAHEHVFSPSYHLLAVSSCVLNHVRDAETTCRF